MPETHVIRKTDLTRRESNTEQKKGGNPEMRFIGKVTPKDFGH